MAETYFDDDGTERCDDCDEPVFECTCACDVTGDSVHECAGPGCEHDESAEG